VSEFEGQLKKLLEAAVSQPPGVVDAGAVRARARRQQRRRRSAISVGVAIVAAIAALVPLTLTRNQGQSLAVVGAGVATPPATASPSLHVGDTAPPSSVTSPTSAGGSPEPPGFGVAGVSFISTTQGWALGTTGCAGCAGVAVTDDGGQTWVDLPSPPTTFWWSSHMASAVTNLTFANSSDGYLYAPGLLATTNGGRTWVAQQLANVNTVTVAGDYAYALTGYDRVAPARLYRAKLGTNDWIAVSLPVKVTAEQSFQTAAAGADLVLLEVGAAEGLMTVGQTGQIWVSSDQGTSWQPRPVPCTVTDGGATVLSVATEHPAAWLVDCYNGEQSSQEQDTMQHIYGTADAAQTWVRLGNPPQHNSPVLLADNGAGHAFLATEGIYGSSAGLGDTLNGTLNGGVTWAPAVMDGGSFNGWADLGFISADIGFVVGPTNGTADHLYRTTDGGVTWNVLAVSP
jgi:photosystem II stability/assembly factor-like uncharacterized protein